MMVRRLYKPLERATGKTDGRPNMSSFEPAAVLTLHHFEVSANGRGYWVAKDKEGMIGGVFRTQKDALRFALFEAAGDSAIAAPRCRVRIWTAAMALMDLAATRVAVSSQPRGSVTNPTTPHLPSPCHRTIPTPVRP